MEELKLHKQSLNTSTLIQRNSHLKALPIESYSDAIPRILIDIDNSKLQVPLKICEGNENHSVIASKTRLGWCAYGCSAGSVGRNLSFAGCHSFHMCECTKGHDKLHDIVKQYFALDSLKPIVSKNLDSVDNRHASELMELTTRKYNNRYEIGLLWKYPNATILNSFPMAKRRLACLVQRMERDPELKSSHYGQVEEYVAKGYAKKLSQVETASTNRVW